MVQKNKESKHLNLLFNEFQNTLFRERRKIYKKIGKESIFQKKIDDSHYGLKGTNDCKRNKKAERHCEEGKQKVR